MSEALCDALHSEPGPTSFPVPAGVDPMLDEDLQLFLAVCYGLHSYGIEGVDDCWEWEPSLISQRRLLERRFEGALRETVTVPQLHPEDLPGWLTDMSREQMSSLPLARFMARRATEEQFREFVIHRSIYTLHEADPHTFAIPRVRGRAKAALVEIQMDEYGSGETQRIHAQMFRSTMKGLGLDPEPDAYLDLVPAATLATSNLVWMFGLQRGTRGALIGHLALFESTSTAPNRAYANGLRRLGFGGDVTAYYDEHVEADAVHETIARFDLVGALISAEPAQAAQVAFGALALREVEGASSGWMLERWSRGESSLHGETTSLAAGSLAS
jgi:Iron-containing redox enzyme